MGHKAKVKKGNVKGKPKEKKKTIWPEAHKRYPSLKLDLRPKYFEESYKQLMDDIVALLGIEVINEMLKLPKKDRKPSKVNGKQYTPAQGSGGFLVHLLPASGNPKDEVILLYGLEDLYLQGFHEGEVWFLLSKATIDIPPSTQVPYGRPAGLEEDEESPFDNGVFILPWSGSYTELEGGQLQLFHSEAFGGAYDKLKQAKKLVIQKKGFSLQRPVAFFAVGISEAVRFENIGDWVLIQSTRLLEKDGVPLTEELYILTNDWGVESDACYGPNHKSCVRVVKRNRKFHLELKTEILYQKKETKKLQIEEVKDYEEEEEQTPLVSVKETIQGESVGLIGCLECPLEIVERTTPDGKFSVRVRVSRLPDALTTVLDDHAELLADIICSNSSQDVGSSATDLREKMVNAIDTGLKAMSPTVEKSRVERYRKTLLGHFQRIWALGPSQAAQNLLISPDDKESRGLTTNQDGREGILVCGPCHISEKLGFVTTSNANNGIDERELSTCAPYSEELRNRIILGFYLATCNGPLADEPLWGLAFIIEPYVFAEGSYQDCTFSWQVTKTVQEACIAAVRQSNPRIVEPMCLCELTMPSHRLDAVRAALQNCRGKVLREEMPKGAPLFTVHAHLPVAERSKFSDNLRKKTSAAAHAQLVFSHWEAIPQDPFLIPKTQEEIEEFGVGPNLARALMVSVRQRKGLHVEELGEEQLTHGKKVMEGKKHNEEDINKDMPIDEEGVQGSGLEISEPLAPFKETIVGVKGQLEFVERTTPDGKFSVRIGVYRLPDDLTKVLDDCSDLLAQTIGSQSSQDIGSAATELREKMVRAMHSGLEAISGRVNEERRQRYKMTVLGHFHRIWALGPSQAASNILISPDAKSSSSVITTEDGREGIRVCGRCHVSESLGFVNAETDNGIDNIASATDVPESEALKNSIILGFQVATGAGPLCEEPMWGMAFIVEPYTFADKPFSVRCSNPYQQHIFNWHVTNAVREACREAVLQSKPRLVQLMYFCELTTPAEELGAVHALLGDCRAKVLKEEMQEGTSLFTVHANLPVAGSSEFCEKLGNIISGAAIPHLAISHWETIPQDPFFIPRTQEEIEKFGDGSNFARTLLSSVRRRKGLHVEDGTEEPSGAKKV